MSGSIDFIDESGREWAHASRYRVLEEEISALRKRVEGLEITAKGWKASALDNRALLEAVGRAEKAEAENATLRKRVEELERVASPWDHALDALRHNIERAERQAPGRPRHGAGLPRARPRQPL